MAKKAEEYGSHDKTFEIAKAGKVLVKASGGQELFSHDVEVGDIWRMCQTKAAPIEDWVKLAVGRARASGAKAIFWLDPLRAHDSHLMRIAKAALELQDTTGLDIVFMSPVEAMQETCKRARKGLDTISVTGNVLRDYLTDLFPILELGTSAKLMSIVPMLAGGAMYETGAGGTAPKLMQQFQKEGHLTWDSLGEYLALSSAFGDLGASNPKAKVMATALDKAVGSFLNANKNPSRKVNEMDNRGSHYWLARYWADELSQQKDDAALQKAYVEASKAFAAEEATILSELINCQGPPVDLGGYYKVDKAKTDAAMNPSPTLNKIIADLGK